MVCGKPLIYFQKRRSIKCYYCGIDEETLACCSAGHFVCDKCHSIEAIDLITEVCTKTKSTSPLDIAEGIMTHPSIPLNGPEHHVLVPAVLLAASRNAKPELNLKFDAIQEAIERGKKVPGGWCGFYGCCGAAVGLGIAVSILSSATPLKGRERALANLAVSKGLKDAADGGPVCCKRMVRRILKIAIPFLKRYFNIKLNPFSSVQICQYTRRNNKCIKLECPYFHNVN